MNHKIFPPATEFFREPISATAAILGLIFASGLVAANEKRNDLNPVRFLAAPQHPPVVLVEGGKPLASIALMDPAPSQLLQLVVGELQEVIELTTGARLPIVKGKIEGRAIIIGDCDLARENGLDGARMPPEGLAIKTSPDHVFIVGNASKGPSMLQQTGQKWEPCQGTAWGVNEFMERFVGVRWYYQAQSGGRSILKKDSLMVEPVYLQDAPVYRMRTFYPNPHVPPYPFLRAGNSWPVVLMCHAPCWWKVKEYTEKRPECFQLRADGTRLFDMICYGNPRTLETYLENIALAYDRQDPSRLERYDYISVIGDAITVSPNDLEVVCQCATCRQLWDANGGQYGTASRIMGDFVARLATEVKRRWPGKTVVFLPYMNYTIAPSGIHFPDNVEVQICGMPGLAQYKEPNVLKPFQDNIERWRELTGRKVQTWEYCCWPEDRTKAPYQYPHVLKNYYQSNRDKIVGSFINGVEDHLPRQHVSLYCWLKLLWNPDFDVDAMMDEYCRRMYGPAAATVRELLRIQTDGWEQSRWPGGRFSIKGVYEASYPKATVGRMRELLEKARAEIGTDPELKRHLDYFATPFPRFFEEAKAIQEGGALQDMVTQKVGDNPIIDGKLDDAVWERAAGVRFQTEKGTPPQAPAEAKAVWTAEGITFGFRMTEPLPDKIIRDIKANDDGNAWWNDNIEVFLDVTGKKEGEYYQFIVNANGAVYDSKIKDASWNAKGLKVSTFLGKDFWSMEVFIPYRTFPEAKRPATGVEWSAQFTRHRLIRVNQEEGKGIDKKGEMDGEYTRMNMKMGGPSNNLADFGALKFVE